MRLILSVFLLGLSLGAGPCMASCGPLLVSYAAGTRKSALAGMRTYILFSLGRLGVYLALGGGVFFLGNTLAPDAQGLVHRALFIAGGAFILGVGVLILIRPTLNHRLCQKASALFLQQDAKTALTLGIIIGVLPCAPLFSVVSYIGLIAKSWIQAVFYSLAFGLGTVVSPLLLLVAATGVFPRIFRNNDRWYGIFTQVCAGVIILLGLNLIWRAF